MHKLQRQLNHRDFPNASNTQFVVAQYNKEQSQKQYEELKKKYDELVEQNNKQGLTIAAALANTLQELQKLLAEDKTNGTKKSDELKDAKDRLSKLHQEQMEAITKDLREANEAHEKEMRANTERQLKIAKDHEAALQALQEMEQKHDDKVKEHDDKVREHDNRVAALLGEIAALEKRLQEEQAKNKDVDALHQQITQLQAEIERLTRDLADLRAAEKTAQAALQAEIARLCAALADAVAAHADPAALLTAQAQVTALKKEIARLHKQMQTMTASVENTLRQNRAGLAELKQTIDANVQREIEGSNLLQKMTQETPDYAAVRRAVQATQATAPRATKLYSSAALFLILESMGATWCMWLKNTGIKQRTPELDRLRAIIFRQILYDLTMWDSIANPDKKTRYVSAYTAGFIAHFKLSNTEVVDNNAPPSSDDEASGDAAPDVATLDRERLRAEEAQRDLQSARDDDLV